MTPSTSHSPNPLASLSRRTSFLRTFFLRATCLCVAVMGVPMSALAAEPAASAPASAPASKATSTARSAKASKPQKAAAKTAPEVAPEPVADAATDEHKLAVAKQVHTGRIACELGAHVTVTPDAAHTGGFVVQLGAHTFQMTPVVSSTGAVRLEDTKRGAMWLQLGNKSMLMNTKLGQRMADECQSPAQLAVAESLKRNPQPSLLEDPSVARK